MRTLGFRKIEHSYVRRELNYSSIAAEIYKQLQGEKRKEKKKNECQNRQVDDPKL